jgi:hypothetical protein
MDITDLKPKWEILKNDYYSTFTNLDYERVKEKYVELFKSAPNNTTCHSCINRTIKMVFLELERIEKLKNVNTDEKSKTFRKRRGHNL